MIKLGTQDIKRVFLGSSFVKRAYIGTEKVYDIYNDPVSALFFRRQTAGGSVTSPALPQYGKALLSTIKGNSMVRNQQCSNGEAERTFDASYSSGSYAANIVNGHSYLIKFISNLTSVPPSGNFRVWYGSRSINFGTLVSGAATYSYIFTAATDASSFTVYIVDPGSLGGAGTIKYAQIIDLTLLFNGAVPAGYTVADFERDFPLDYYDYNPGQIIDLKGARLWWNQLVNGCNTSSEVYGITRTAVDKYTVHYSGTSGTSTNFTGTLGNLPVIQGHKYYGAANGAPSGCTLGGSTNLTFSGVTSRSGICEATGTSNSCSLGLNIPSGTYIDNDVHFILTDLTAMYGAGNEPTLQDFEAQFGADYYPYNAGEWINRAFLETVGWNQWDEEREGGAFDADGNPTSGNADAFRSKNFTRVSPSTDYCLAAINATSGCYFYITEYDGNKTKIKTSSGMTPTEPRVFTTTATTAHIKFHFYVRKYYFYLDSIYVSNYYFPLK